MPAVTFSGIASGIDGEAIIKALLDARRVALIPSENKLFFNQSETTALEEVNTKLLALRDALKEFSTISGGAISRVASSSNEDAIEAVAGTNANLSSTTVTVQNLARAATISFNDRFTAFDTPLAPNLAAPAMIDLTFGTGSTTETISVEVTAETTLADLAGKINEEGEDKVIASIVNLSTSSTPSYALMLNGVQSGLEKGTLSVNVAQEIQDQGIFAGATTLQAQDAKFTIDGLGDVTRATNTVSDLIPGVTLTLKQANAGPVTISVSDDPEKTAERVASVVTAMNDLITYAKENGKIEIKQDEETGSSKNTYGPLAKSNVDNLALSAIRTAVQSLSLDQANSSVQIFADLGIKTNKDDGTYDFDAKRFKEALAEDPAGAHQLLTSFSDLLTKTGGTIDEFTKFQGHIDSALDANTTENESLNDYIDRVERSITSEEERLKRTFARLESTIGQLNSQATALTSIIAGLQR